MLIVWSIRRSAPISPQVSWTTRTRWRSLACHFTEIDKSPSRPPPSFRLWYCSAYSYTVWSLWQISVVKLGLSNRLWMSWRSSGKIAMVFSHAVPYRIWSRYWEKVTLEDIESTSSQIIDTDSNLYYIFLHVYNSCVKQFFFCTNIYIINDIKNLQSISAKHVCNEWL